MQKILQNLNNLIFNQEIKNVQISFDRLFAKKFQFFFRKTYAIRFLMSKAFQKAKGIESLTQTLIF